LPQANEKLAKQQAHTSKANLSRKKKHKLPVCAKGEEGGIKKSSKFVFLIRKKEAKWSGLGASKKIHGENKGGKGKIRKCVAGGINVSSLRNHRQADRQ
jgi:hypothetical protein